MEYTPITRNTEKVVNDQGVTSYRAYSSANPKYYKNDKNIFLPIGSDIKETSSSIGNILLKDESVISIGTRKDSNPSKYLGMRPDSNQHLGSEQMEFSIEEIIINGDNQDIDLTKNDVVDSTITDLGNVVVENSRNYLRQLVKAPDNLTDFKITFKIHIRGMTLLNSVNNDGKVNKDSRNRFHFITHEGRHFIIVIPQLLDKDFNRLTSWLDHSMTNNGDGTYTYIKFPLDYQKEVGFHEDTKYIDAVTSWSALKDGYIQGNKKVITACVSPTYSDHYLMRHNISLGGYAGSGFSIHDTSTSVADFCYTAILPSFGGYTFFDLRPFTGSLQSGDTCSINFYIHSALSTSGTSGTHASGVADDIIIRPFYNASVGTKKHVTYNYSLQNSSSGGTASDDYISFEGYASGSSCTTQAWDAASRVYQGQSSLNSWWSTGNMAYNSVAGNFINTQLAYTGGDAKYKWASFTYLTNQDEIDHSATAFNQKSRKRGYYGGSGYEPYLELTSSNVTTITNYGSPTNNPSFFQSHF